MSNVKGAPYQATQKVTVQSELRGSLLMWSDKQAGATSELGQALATPGQRKKRPRASESVNAVVHDSDEETEPLECVAKPTRASRRDRMRRKT